MLQRLKQLAVCSKPPIYNLIENVNPKFIEEEEYLGDFNEIGSKEYQSIFQELTNNNN